MRRPYTDIPRSPRFGLQRHSPSMLPISWGTFPFFPRRHESAVIHNADLTIGQAWA